MRIILAIFLIIVFTQCKNTTEEARSDYDHDHIPVEIITDSSVDYSGCDTVVFEKNDIIVQLDSIIEELQMIQLETNSECLIGSTQKGIWRNKKIYIFDSFRSKNAIHVFDVEGKHFGTILKTGRGPGEYRDIMDFDVDENGKIYILNTSGGSIIVYDQQLNFIGSVSPEIYLSSFCIFNKSIVGMVDRTGYRNPAMRVLYILNMDGTTRASFFPFTEQTGGVANVSTHLVRHNDEVFINLPYCETVFSMDTLFNIRARVHLVRNYKDERGDTRNLFHTKPFKDFFQAESFFYTTAGSNPIIPGFSNGESTLYSMVSRNKISSGDINPFPLDGMIENNTGLSIIPVDYLISNLRVDGVVSYTDNNNVKHLVKDMIRLGGDTLPGSLYDRIRKMDENDNPVIMLVKLKPF